MKKICASAIVMSLILVAFAVSVSAVEQTDIIRNDESGIPDRNLYQQLILDFDKNDDGLLQLSEVENVKVEAMLQEPDLPMGDANEDFKVTIEDVTFIQKYIADIEVIKEGTPQYYAADVNCDGSINIEDAITIQKYIAEIITEL